MSCKEMTVSSPFLRQQMNLTGQILHIFLKDQQMNE